MHCSPSHTCHINARCSTIHHGLLACKEMCHKRSISPSMRGSVSKHWSNSSKRTAYRLSSVVLADQRYGRHGRYHEPISTALGAERVSYLTVCRLTVSRAWACGKLARLVEKSMHPRSVSVLYDLSKSQEYPMSASTELHTTTGLLWYLC